MRTLNIQPKNQVLLRDLAGISSTGGGRKPNLKFSRNCDPRRKWKTECELDMEEFWSTAVVGAVRRPHPAFQKQLIDAFKNVGRHLRMPPNHRVIPNQPD